MMAYFPKEWLVDPKKEMKVYRLLNSLPGDLRLIGYAEKQEEYVRTRLREIGETKILQELDAGNIIFF